MTSHSPEVLSPRRTDDIEPSIDPLIAAAQAELDNSRKLRQHRHDESTSLSREVKHTTAGALFAHAKRASRPHSLSPARSTGPVQTDATSPSSFVRSVEYHSLEDAVNRVRTLLVEVSSLKAALDESEASRRHASSLWESETRQRQDTEVQLHDSRQKIDELKAALSTADTRVHHLRISVEQLTDELRLSSNELAQSQAARTSMKEEIVQLNLQLEERFKKDADAEVKMSSLQSTADAMSHAVTEWRHKHEATTSEWKDANLRHSAEVELLRAQQAAACSALQHTVDAQTLQIQEARCAYDALKGEHEQDTTVMRERLERTQRALDAANREIDRAGQESVSLKQLYEEDSHSCQNQLDQLRQEARASKQREERALAQLEKASQGVLALEQQLTELRDVNHILAVRLKSSTVEREAMEMEAEARRLLVRQNEDMERQLGELRRTIQSLIGSGQRDLPSDARSIARGTHPLSSMSPKH